MEALEAMREFKMLLDYGTEDKPKLMANRITVSRVDVKSVFETRQRGRGNRICKDRCKIYHVDLGDLVLEASYEDVRDWRYGERKSIGYVGK